jgi:hypothetical protein
VVSTFQDLRQKVLNFSAEEIWISQGGWPVRKHTCSLRSLFTCLLISVNALGREYEETSLQVSEGDRKLRLKDQHSGLVLERSGSDSAKRLAIFINVYRGFLQSLQAHSETLSWKRYITTSGYIHIYAPASVEASWHTHTVGKTSWGENKPVPSERHSARK